MLKSLGIQGFKAVFDAWLSLDPFTLVIGRNGSGKSSAIEAIVIEEIENGLDPWTLEHVLDALREVSGEIQVLLTTHSPFLLDHVRPREVIHVRREKGDTTYQRVSDLAEVAKYEQVLAPGAMYLSDVFRSGAGVGHGDAR